MTEFTKHMLEGFRNKCIKEQGNCEHCTIKTNCSNIFGTLLVQYGTEQQLLNAIEQYFGE